MNNPGGTSAPPPPKNGLSGTEREVQTADAFAILSTLFAGVQAQLLSGIPSDTPPHFSRGIIGTLQFFSYGGLVINISASLAAIFYISLANMEQDNGSPTSKDERTGEPTSDHGTPLSLEDNASSDHEFQEEVRNVLNQLRYFYLSLTFLGTYFILLQIALLTWTTKNMSKGVFWVVIVIIWISFIPLNAYTQVVRGEALDSPLRSRGLSGRILEGRAYLKALYLRASFR